MPFGSLRIEVTVRRVRVVFGPLGDVDDVLGIDGVLCGEPFEVRFDGVTDWEWSRGTFIPFSEL